MSTKLEKKREKIKRIISEIAFEACNPRFKSAVITDVKLSSDMSHATIYIDVIEDEEETLKAFRNSKGFFRLKLASYLNPRYTPKLDFQLDNSMKRARKIEEILAEERKKEG
jgi:ribosome-binding factor A